MTLRKWLEKRGNPVGYLIVLANGNKLLVGDINQLGGRCDDCTDDDMDVEVAEVKRVYNPEDRGTQKQGEPNA